MNSMRYPRCGSCGYGFPMAEATYDGYERSGKTFYCPQGHPLVIRQNDIVTQLRASERLLRRSEDQVHKFMKEAQCARGVIT